MWAAERSARPHVSDRAACLRLRVSTELEPAVFDEAVLPALGARIVHRVHIGWITLEMDPDLVPELRLQPGVQEALIVTACDDRLDQLPRDLQWRELVAADCHGLLDWRLEAGLAGHRVVALRQTAHAKETCFLRSHRTDAMDLVVSGDGPSSSGVAVRHSDGVRDRTLAGMHNWKQGAEHAVTMWVGHLPAGPYRVQGGVDGWIRVKGRPTPWTLETTVRLGPG